jgi:hypothetical protein
MKKLTSLFSLFISFNLFADCTIGGQTIKDGVSVSLYDEGKSLAGKQVNDQDGLNISYASALSTSLASAHPSHPSLSYLDIALQYKEKASSTDKGLECGILDQIKKNGGVCTQNSMSIEGQSDSSIQARVLITLSRFLEQGSQHSNAAKAQALEIKKMVKEVTKIKKKNCEYLVKNSNVYDKAAELIYMGALKNLWIQKHASSGCKEWAIETSKKIDPNFNLESDKYSPSIKKELVQELSKLLSVSSYLGSLENVFADKTYDEKMNASKSSLDQEALKIGNLLKSQLQKIGGSIPYNCSLVSLQDTKGLTKNGHHILSEIGYSWNNLKSCETFMAKGLQNDLYRGLAPVTCDNELAAGVTSSAFAALLELGVDVDKIESVLSSNDLASTKPYYDLLGPNCAQYRVDMSQLSCEGHLAPQTKSEESQKKWTQSVSEKAGSSLLNGKAVVVQTCTRLLISETDRCDHYQDSAFVNLTGYSCQDGKLRYEVAQSWGKNCISKGQIECEYRDGEPNGRFWIDENHLARNAREIKIIK